MISRDEAARIAAEAAVAHRVGFEVEKVLAISEMMFVAPNVYGVDLSTCWVAYILPLDTFRIGSSLIVAVDQQTGKVIYCGSANDEG